MNPADLRERLHGDVVAVRAIALGAAASLERPVPTCPGWTIGELLGHLGSVERWVAATLASGVDADEPPAPAGARAGARWFLDGADGFLDAIDAIEPDAPCWGFDLDRQTQASWLRRQAHEHAIHRFDAEAALGRSDAPDAALAVDGVDEVVSVMLPRQLRLGRVDPDAIEPVRLRATEAVAPGEWMVRGSDGDREPVATVDAPAGRLYLLLWGRERLASLPVTGDRDRAERTFALSITP